MNQNGNTIMKKKKKTARRPVVRGKAGNKRDAILDIASELFLQKGYAGASINEMYRQTGISKETFYRYFRNKEELFLAVIDEELKIYWQGLSVMEQVDGEKNMRDILTRVGADLIRFLVSKRTMALRQLIFSECQKHPKIGKLYFSHGPDQAYHKLQSYFNGQKKEGVRFALPSARLAEYFVAMLLHKITLEQQCRIKKVPDNTQIRKMARTVAGDFVRICVVN